MYRNMTLTILAICFVLLGIIIYISKNPNRYNTTESPALPSLYLGETKQYLSIFQQAQ